MRWALTIAAVLACGCVLSGCAQETKRATPALVVGVCDPMCEDTASPCIQASAKRDYRVLAPVVKEQCGIELTLKFYTLDEQLVEAVERGEVNAAIAKTWTVLCASKGRTFERIADVPRPDGVTELSGVFITRADSPLSTIGDLNGKTVALRPDVAYEKSHAARRALREAGVTPGAVRILDGCVPVAAAVFEKKVDAGVVSDYVTDFGGLALVSDPKDFKIIGRTEPVPFITFAVSTDVEAPVRAKLRNVLLKLCGDTVPAGLHTSGFVEATPWTPVELERK